MPQFRKKPVVIEAVRFTGTNDDEVLRFVGGLKNATPSVAGMRIPTLEGTMVAYPGDWIIRGVVGEYYPCRPDIFAATYEPVPAPAAPTNEVQDA